MKTIEKKISELKKVINKLDYGDYRAIKPVKFNNIVLEGYQFNPDSGWAFTMFQIDGCFYDQNGFKSVFNVNIEEAFPELCKEIKKKIECFNKSFSRLASLESSIENGIS